MEDLKRLLKTILTRAERDSRFERKAVTALRTLLSTDGGSSKSRRFSMDVLRKTSPADYAAEHGTEALRRYLEQFSTKDLREYVREGRLSQSGVSKLAKDDVINRILVAARKAA